MAGKYAFIANEGGNPSTDGLAVFQLNHLEAPTIQTGSLGTGNLDVADNAVINNDLDVHGGLNVGPNGARIDGELSVDGAEDSYIRGQLGIQRTSPTHRLDINDWARIRGNTNTNLVVSGAGSDIYVDLTKDTEELTTTPSARIEFDGNSDPTSHIGLLRFYTRGAGDGSLQPRLTIGDNGNTRPSVNNAYSLGESNLKWTEVWAVNGTIQTSDGRLKENVTEIPYGLDEIDQLRPVTFTWIDGGQRSHYGLIAQEVAEILPEVVVGSEDEEGALGMNYGELVPVLVSAIQEQQDEIEVQSGQIEELEDRLEALETNSSRASALPESSSWLMFGGLALLGVAVIGRRWTGGRS